MTPALNPLELPEVEANGTLWIWGQIVLYIECEDNQDHVEKADLKTHTPKIKNLVNELNYSIPQPQDVPTTQTTEARYFRHKPNLVKEAKAMEQKAAAELCMGSWVCLWPCT